MVSTPIVIATRGSALALAQANLVLEQCRTAFPDTPFELKILKTTGDKLQTASLANPSASLPKGLFTKELELALLRGEADLAVHSLKDLPTELPAGLRLAAVSKRADVRDVLIVRGGDSNFSAGSASRRGFSGETSISNLPAGSCIATSSTRRQAQVMAIRPDLRTTEIRGNVLTRLQKLAGQPELDALVLAAAGLERLHFTIESDGRLRGESVPESLRAMILPTEVMLPCAGQAALGIEAREGDARIDSICSKLDDFHTHQCVLAERSFLNEMGGGCQSPVAALAECSGESLRLRAISFAGHDVRKGVKSGPVSEAETLGRALARELKS